MAFTASSSALLAHSRHGARTVGICPTVWRQQVRLLHHDLFLIDGILRRPKLSRMLLRRLLPPLYISLLGVLLANAAGCERRTPASRADTVTLQPEIRPASTPSNESASGWPAAAGSALLIQGETRDEAIVLFPAATDSGAVAHFDTLGYRGAEVTLFGRGGARLSAQLGAPPGRGDAECVVWPLRGVRSAGADTTWAVGFSSDQTLALALDSVEVLSTRDSLALVAEASRLASTVTVPTPPFFQGLRFSVHDIRRFEGSPGVEAIVAHLLRKVNQEANPQEEQTLLIAERDSGVTAGPYHLVYAERTHGLEETTVTPEVIAGVRIAGRPTLIVARDGEEGVAYAMLERTGPGRWRLRWTSSRTRCA